MSINGKAVNCTLNGLHVATVIIDASNDNIENSKLAMPVIFQVGIVVFSLVTLESVWEIQWPKFDIENDGKG